MPIPIEKLTTIQVDIRDTSGRYFVNQKNEHVFIDNPLPGRENRKTQMSAFREFGEHTADVYSLIQFLRLGYSEDRLNIMQLYNFSLAIYELPVYIAVRPNSGDNTTKIPPSLIDAHRAGLGITGVAAVILETGISEDTYFSADEIYNFANGENSEGANLFLSGDGFESCPAPEITVKRILNLMINKQDTDSVSFSSADWRHMLAVDDIKPCLEFGENYYAFFHYLREYSKNPNLSTEDRGKAEEILEDLYQKINVALGVTT